MQAEQDALAEARRVKDLADTATAVVEAGKERIRHAKRDAEQEIDRRTQSAREHLTQVLDNERDRARREAAEAVERVAADVRASAEKALQVAQAAAEAAKDRIDTVRRQMDAARSLAEETQAKETAVAVHAEQAEQLPVKRSDIPETLV